MEEGHILSTIADSIATITFYHPQSNSMPGKLLHQLATEITNAGNNKEVKVIVLQSEGEKTFCAGASFDELLSINDTEKGKQFFSGFAMVINAMRKAPKFIIARVQGKAVGGGVGLVCAADYAIAVEAAAVKLSELTIGIGPFVVGPAVERKIGTAAFTSLTINASEWKSPEWAKEKGMYDELVKTSVELDKAIQALSQALAVSNPEAMLEIKKIAWEGTENWDHLLTERAQISGQLVLSDFTKKALQKFKAKN